jgi:hypothetical protein
MKNFKVFTELISIFTYVCANFHDSIPLVGKYCLFQKSKLLLGMYIYLKGDNYLRIQFWA